MSGPGEFDGSFGDFFDNFFGDSLYNSSGMIILKGDPARML